MIKCVYVFFEYVFGISCICLLGFELSFREMDIYEWNGIELWNIFLE